MGQNNSAGSQSADDLLAAALEAEQLQQDCEARGDWDSIEGHANDSWNLLERAAAATG